MKFCETVYVFPSTQQMLSEPIDRICHSTFVPSSEFELSATPFLKHLFLSSVILLFQALPPSPEIHSFLHYCYLIFLPNFCPEITHRQNNQHHNEVNLSLIILITPRISWWTLCGLSCHLCYLCTLRKTNSISVHG